MIEIQTWGGWGDVLRELSLLPCARLPGRFAVRHLPRQQAGVLEGVRVPDASEVADLVSRAPGLSWAGGGIVPRHHKILCRILRAAIEPFHPALFAPGFCWRNEDGWPGRPRPGAIVVQTHLEGMPSKQWSIPAWQRVIEGLRALQPDRTIHVLDPSGQPLAGHADVIHDRLTFPQALRLVEEAGFLLSVDSWSKYPAAWRRIPQVVIVPDQTPDYPQLSARAIWRHSMRGLRGQPRTTILGLDTRGSRFTFGTLDRLDPAQVIEAAAQLLRPSQPCSRKSVARQTSG